MQVRIKYESQHDAWTRNILVPYNPSLIRDLMLSLTKRFPNCDIYITQYGIQLACAKWMRNQCRHNIVVCIDPARVTETINAILGKMPQERLKQALDTEPNPRASLFVELPKTP